MGDRPHLSYLSNHILRLWFGAVGEGTKTETCRKKTGQATAEKGRKEGD
jgi:hypothetical protein